MVLVNHLPFVWLRMFLVLIPVIYIQFCQVLRLDDQQILSVLLLSSLGEIKATCDNCFPVDDHDLVMSNSVLVVNVSLYTLILQKGGRSIFF